MLLKPTISSRAMARPNAGGRPRLCADQSFTHFKFFLKVFVNLAKAQFGLDFWLPFDQAKGRRTSIIAWTLILCR